MNHFRFRFGRPTAAVIALLLTAVVPPPLLTTTTTTRTTTPIVVATAQKFLTDGTVSPTDTPLFPPAATQDCATWYGITTEEECQAACGRFLQIFQVYTVNWIWTNNNDNTTTNSNSNDNDNTGPEGRPTSPDDVTAATANNINNQQSSDDGNGGDAQGKGGLRTLYGGFACRCPNQSPSIDCLYSYPFPTCQDVGVVDCSGDDAEVVSNTGPSTTIPPPPPSPSVVEINEEGVEEEETETVPEETLNVNATGRMRRLQDIDDSANATTITNSSTTTNNTNDDTIVDSVLNSTNIGNNTNTNSNFTHTNITDVTDTTNTTNATNSNTTDEIVAPTPPTKTTTPISCASYCLMLGMDVGAPSQASQTSKKENTLATRTICARNPGGYNTPGPWVACACKVRADVFEDDPGTVRVLEGFYVCGDVGFNTTGIVIGSGGDTARTRIRVSTLVATVILALSGTVLVWL